MYFRFSFFVESTEIFDLSVENISFAEGFHKINKDCRQGVLISLFSGDMEDVSNECDTVTFGCEFESEKDYEATKEDLEAHKNEHSKVNISCVDPLSKSIDRIEGYFCEYI
jgi:hypothetical protein